MTGGGGGGGCGLQLGELNPPKAPRQRRTEAAAPQRRGATAPRRGARRGPGRGPLRASGSGGGSVGRVGSANASGGGSWPWVISSASILGRMNIHFGQHPFAIDFHVHQGYRILTHCVCVLGT